LNRTPTSAQKYYSGARLVSNTHKYVYSNKKRFIIFTGIKPIEMSHPVRIIIVEDNELFRGGLRYLLNFSDDFECVGDFGTGPDGLKAIKKSVPDVVLMDIDLPGMNGVECTKTIKTSSATAHCQVIMLTILEDEYGVLEAILAGASGYLLKNSSPESIMDAIRQVCSGGSPMSPAIARKVFGLMKMNYSYPEEKIILNKREAEVLEGLVNGLTYKMIGEKHFIAVDTVRNYIRSIYEKLQVNSRSEAVVKAIKYRLL
jgi:DNA-binding NarL/FixJ family response regulator